MLRLCWMLVAIGYVVGIVACSNMEQVYEGMYKGAATANEMQMSREDPAYEPAQAQSEQTLSYKEYKREREQILEGESSAHKDGKSD